MVLFVFLLKLLVSSRADVVLLVCLRWNELQAVQVMTVNNRQYQCISSPSLHSANSELSHILAYFILALVPLLMCSWLGMLSIYEISIGPCWCDHGLVLLLSVLYNFINVSNKSIFLIASLICVIWAYLWINMQMHHYKCLEAPICVCAGQCNCLFEQDSYITCEKLHKWTWDYIYCEKSCYINEHGTTFTARSHVTEMRSHLLKYS